MNIFLESGKQSYIIGDVEVVFEKYDKTVVVIDKTTILTDVPENAVFIDTTYSNFTTTNDGLVPAPTAGNTGKYLKGDGSWATPPDTETTIVNNLNSNSATSALSANMGRELFQYANNGKSAIAAAIVGKGGLQVAKILLHN